MFQVQLFLFRNVALRNVNCEIENCEALRGWWKLKDFGRQGCDCERISAKRTSKLCFGKFKSLRCLIYMQNIVQMVRYYHQDVLLLKQWSSSSNRWPQNWGRLPPEKGKPAVMFPHSNIATHHPSSFLVEAQERWLENKKTRMKNTRQELGR